MSSPDIPHPCRTDTGSHTAKQPVGVTGDVWETLQGEDPGTDEEPVFQTCGLRMPTKSSSQDSSGKTQNT